MTANERTGVTRHEGGNLSFGERAVYVAAGLGLAALATKPRPNPLLNVVALAGGVYLAWSGYEGNCAVKDVIRDLT